MDAAKQRVRAVAARKKEEAKNTKGQEGTSLSVPKAVFKGSAKRKLDGEDDRPSKKVVVTPGDAHPKKSPPKPGRGAGKGMTISTGPIIEGPYCLLTDKDYAVKEVQSLIKPTDVDSCAELGTEELRASALFYLTRVNPFSWLISSPFFSLFFSLSSFFFLFFLTDDRTLFQALVCVKALHDRCVAKEGVVTRVRKHNTNLLNEQKQYKEALRTLNAELKETREKLEGAGLWNKELEEGLTTLRQQVEKVGADAVQKFKASQSYVDSCANYYGTGFDDCLK